MEDTERPKRSWEVDWNGAVTLEECVIKMIQEKKTKTPEFEALLKHFGRGKLEKIWKDHISRKNKTPETDGKEDQNQKSDRGLSSGDPSFLWDCLQEFHEWDCGLLSDPPELDSETSLDCEVEIEDASPEFQRTL
jgi:hypothetical protein